MSTLLNPTLSAAEVASSVSGSALALATLVVPLSVHCLQVTDHAKFMSLAGKLQAHHLAQ